MARRLCRPKKSFWRNGFFGTVQHCAEFAQTVAPQKSLLPSHQVYLQNKVAKLEKKQKHVWDKNRAYKLKDIKQKLVEVTTHIKNGIVTPAIFGGKNLWKKVVRGAAGARDKWRKARSNQYYISGDKSAVVAIRITGANQWVEFPAEFTENQHRLTLTFSQTNYRKAVRLIRLAPFKYQVNITADEPGSGKELFWKQPIIRALVCGIDLNLDHLTASMTDQNGQFKGFKTFKHPNFGELPKNKSEQQIYLLAKDVVNWCKSQGASAIVLDDLNIIQSPEQSTTLNRRTMSFSHRQLHDGVVVNAQRQGINIKEVNPAYTSWLGN